MALWHLAKGYTADSTENGVEIQVILRLFWNNAAARWPGELDLAPFMIYPTPTENRSLQD